MFLFQQGRNRSGAGKAETGRVTYPAMVAEWGMPEQGKGVRWRTGKSQEEKEHMWRLIYTTQVSL